MLSRLVRLAVLSLAICFIFPVTSFAWNALGHMVVADIAYQRLKPEVREKVDKLISFLHNEYPDIGTMLQMAYWPDTIRSQKVETFTHWHYIDQPYIQDGVQPKNLIDSDNIVWAINRVRNVVGQSER